MESTNNYWCGNYGIELEINFSDAEMCSHPGSCDDEIATLEYFLKGLKE